MDKKFSEDNDFDDVLVGVGGGVISVVFLWSSLFFSLFLDVPRHPLETQNTGHNAQLVIGDHEVK